uniref:UPAR/Ly6 domain-containing protein n=1 Tax=Panagrolaimus sp. PS1159 TaxID=55785 RepID=A0AC35GP48_9BILA
MECESGVEFCLEVNCMIHGAPFKFQGCNGQISFDVDGGKPLKNCTEVGTITFTSSGITGQYDCCNTNLCNNKQLNPDA